MEYFAIFSEPFAVQLRLEIFQHGPRGRARRIGNGVVPMMHSILAMAGNGSSTVLAGLLFSSTL